MAMAKTMRPRERSRPVADRARPDGATWRYQAGWSEADLPFQVGTDLEISVLASTVDAAFRAADAAIARRWHGK